MILNIQNMKIIQNFISNYEAEFTASCLSKKNELNQKSVSNLLNFLRKKKLLKNRLEGRNKLFSLNLDNPNIIHFISIMEHYRTSEFYNKNPLIREISEKIKLISKGIVIIFGSYAKKRHKIDSDLDIFIAGQYNENKLEDIEEIYKIDINIKHYPLNIFKKALKKNDPLIEEIIKGHIILKGIQEFVNCLKVLHYEKN
ncbi:MAG: nucleotidyltransferase domain-containing protein [Nanoarchaeota archaeon]|nr:nucleotidyltransferase domain-containing protein [Nanoarchaeota archaeon]